MAYEEITPLFDREALIDPPAEYQLTLEGSDPYAELGAVVTASQTEMIPIASELVL